MRRNRSTSGSSRRSSDIGMGGWPDKDDFRRAAGVVTGGALFIPTLATGAAVVGGATALAPVVGMNYAVTPDPVKEKLKDIGEKWNVGAHSADWKNFANSALSITTVGLSDNKKIREKVKAVGEQWNFGNNSVDTLKSVANLASIAAAFTGVGSLASAMLGASTAAAKTQLVGLVLKDYAIERLENKVIGKVGQELADPYIDHLVKKARRDQMALNAEEEKLRAMYVEQHPGVNALQLMALENPNGLTREQMQVIVNFQKDLEHERANAEGLPKPQDEPWENYYTRYLAEWGITWYPTNDPGAELWIGGGLPPAGTPLNIDGRTTATYQVSASERVPQSLQFTPELKAALDSLYPPKAT